MDVRTKIKVINQIPGIAKFDGALLIVPQTPTWKTRLGKLSGIPPTIRSQGLELVKRQKLKGKHGDRIGWDAGSKLRLGLVVLDPKKPAFEILKPVREALSAMKDLTCRNVLIHLGSLEDDDQVGQLGAHVAATWESLHFQFQKYGSTEKATSPLTLSVYHTSATSGLREILHEALVIAGARNHVRRLAMRAGNDLDAKTYVAELKKLTKERPEIRYKFYDTKSLEKMGAGAFCAVAQGSQSLDGGIVRLSHRRQGATKKLTLVGKGITYDTGGVSLKPPAYMYGMHNDMTGSAVALATFLALIELDAKVELTCYLGITDNAISAKAYRPNDVVTSLSGKTIEVVHTDAEGRMVLADVLHMASQDKADLLMDFATLTGSCVSAIGTTYSGVFSNREDLVGPLIAAGKASGERVWPFPLDPDFADCLDSDVADIKQCRLRGGVDHIEAAMFLKTFVGEDLTWVHTDLSANEHEGGLGGVPTKETGFGPAFAYRFIRDYLEI